jgi:hypothetical protein
MARSINSPGVQITETDLSNYQQIGGGTTVFVPGFAAQGPTDEALLVTSIAELEQVYGAPETPAERYFYYTCKEILNSPATLLTSRLPYGSGSGIGFADAYTALIFPVLSGYNNKGIKTDLSTDITIGEPSIVPLTITDYEKLLRNDFSWSDSTGIVSQNGTTLNEYISSVTVNLAVSAATLTGVQSFYNPPRSVTIEPSDLTVTFTFEASAIVPKYEAEAKFTTSNLTLGVTGGFIIINKAQTTLNEFNEGFYIAIADNTGFVANSDFDSVKYMYTMTPLVSGPSGEEGGKATVSESRLGFALSGTRNTKGQNSVSEVIEFIPTWDFSTSDFQDSVILTVFKVRNSIYEPDTLTYSLVENHVGSFNPNKVTNANVAGSKKIFLEDMVNSRSKNLEMRINPVLTRRADWSKSIKVSNVESGKALWSIGSYVPTYAYNTNKVTGDINQKLARAFVPIETPETATVDLILDAGLSTIFATTSGNSEFSDTRHIDLVPSTENVSNINGTPYNEQYFFLWKSVFDTFNTFVKDIRKDCMFISDPLRYIFVNGPDTKVISLRDKNFSQHIYGPLKRSYGEINTNYAATYGNWVKTYDGFTDTFVWVPASGYAAGVYARTDAATQTWIAPAGLNRGILSNLSDLAFNPNQKQRDFLYTISINPIVTFSGDGFAVFGQKTLQNKPSAFDRINVRRLFLSLERATQQALRYFVFEPNTEFTRTRLKNTITPIFELAKNTEGLYEYLIVCDERNNTPDIIDRNELAVDIYIKPVKAAEFILVNFIATRTGQNFQELI